MGFYMKIYNRLILFILLLASAFVIAGCSKKTNEINISATVGYLSEADYLSGDFNEKIKTSADETGVDVKTYVVMDFSLSGLKNVDEDAVALFSISFSSNEGKDIDIGAAELPSSDYTVDGDGVNARIRLNDGKSKKKDFRFIVSAYKHTAGQFSIKATVSDPDALIENINNDALFKINGEDSFSISGSLSVNENIVPDSKLEFTPSPDGAYYVVTGLGQEVGDKIRVPNEHNGLAVKEIAANTFLDVSYLKEVVLLEGIEKIGANAFKGCSGIESIVIPSSVSVINDGAFEGCTSTVIWCVGASKPNTWSDTWVSEGTDIVWDSGSMFTLEGSTYTFTFDDGRVGLERLMLPEKYLGRSVTCINGNGAHTTKDSVKYIKIPSTVRKIGDYAFYNCTAVTEIKFDAMGCEPFGGALNYTKKSAFDNLGSDVEKLTVRFGNTVKTVPGYIFSNVLNTETEVIISNNVTEIGGSAFADCGGLTDVTIGNGMSSVGHDAFKNCAALVNVHIYDISKWCGINFSNETANPVHYSKGLLINGEAVTDIVIPDKLTYIGPYAFCCITSLKSVHVTDMAKWCELKFGNGQANPLAHAELYVNGAPVKDAVIPDSVKSIGDNTFYGYKSLSSVLIPETVTVIGFSAFCGCEGLTEVTVPSGVTEIKSGTFSSCTGLVSVKLPKSLEKIGTNAFKKCESLKDITIPEKITVVEYGTFEECTSLTSIILPKKVEKVSDIAFRNCTGLVSVTIPKKTKFILGEAFDGCEKLVEVINKSSLDIEGKSVYGHLNKYGLDFRSKKSKIVNKDGYLFFTHKGTNYLLGYNGTGNEYTLPTDYNGQSYEIYKYAFNNNNTVTSVVIPDGVTKIGEKAFYSCFGLVSVTLGKNVSVIEDDAFNLCCKLVEIINNSPLAVAKDASNGMIGINSKEIHTGTSKIVNKDGYLFYTFGGENYLLGYCGAEKNLTLPSEYNGENYKIYNNAFARTKLTSVVIPSGVTEIGGSAFALCNELVSVIIEDGVKSIGGSSFSSCNALLSVKIGNGVTDIGAYAFESCTWLTDVVIGSGVTNIGNHAFVLGWSAHTDIKYAGNEEQWEAIAKHENWNNSTYYNEESKLIYYTIVYTITYNYNGQ